MSLSVQLEDSQPSDAPDEQSLPNYMQRPLAIAPIVPGQTVHAHASDKPKRPSYSTALYSPSEMALKVQLKANKEHQKKLKDLKVKLRRLRAKLRKLKAEYKYSEDEEESEKSEMSTLQDLKRATEQAIRELQIEAAKASKRKGVKKLIFIHKFPESDGNKSSKSNSLEDLGTDLLALIESNKPSPAPSASPLSPKPASPSTQAAQKKEPVEDDTPSLTALEKQAEMEVNFLSKKKEKGKPKASNPGFKITIPEAADITVNQTTAPQFNLPVKPRLIKTAGGQQLLNPLQLNNLAQILPEPIDNTRARKFEPPRPQSLLAKKIHAPGYFSIGCWRDQPERALPSLEGIFPMLDGNDYKFRKFAIKKCATIAKVQGFPAFAIENGGQCLGGKDILQTYNMYGASRACKVDGRGGPWSMEVYKFTKPPSSRRGGIAHLQKVTRLLRRKL